MARILLRRRYLVSATAGPVVIPATSLVSVSAQALQAVQGLPDNSQVRIKLISAVAATDVAGAEHITIQSANLQAYSPSIVQPAFSGAPLGLLNGASFQSELEFWSDEIPLSTFPCALAVLCYNGDSVSHDVDSLTFIARVTIAVYDEPVYEQSNA